MTIKGIFILTLTLCSFDIAFSQENRFSYFEKAFSNSTLPDTSISKRFHTSSLGKIKIETGKIISCDVEEIHNARPIPTIFPRGVFPVQLAIAEDPDGEFVAYSRILFSNSKIAYWKKIDFFPVKMDPGESAYNNCLGVEGIGVGVFMDSLACKDFNTKPHNLWGNLFINRIKKTNSHGLIYAFNGHSFAAFTGNVYICYNVFIGYDKNGKICVLLADLGKIEFANFYN